MSNIPVTFIYKGKEYKGYFSKVAGASSSALFHLNVGGFYWGKLWYVEGHPGFKDGLHAVQAGWRFASNNHPELEALVNEFADLVVAWYE